MKLALVVAAALVAMAGEVQCREVRGAPSGDFDLYVFALSWSPGFCASGGWRKAAEQCQSEEGFVVHGLWPQYERDYPSYCSPPGRSPLRSDIAAVQDLMPSEALARYEWRKHGSCSGLPPERYFAAVAAAWAKVAIPDQFGIPPEDTTTPLAIERAFVDANRLLRTDMIAVDCGRADDGRTVLQEVRICMTKDVRAFRPCPPEVERNSCRARTISVPRSARQ